MKRSNRLVLLIGVFLAIVAFVGILLLIGGGGGGPKPQDPNTITYPTTIASADIPLGTKIRADQVRIDQKTTAQRSSDAFGDVAQVVGQIARQNVANGGEINARTVGAGANGQILNLDVPAGLRAIAVQVDQVTGVGTVIKTGDYVDMVVGIQADKFPVITVNPADSSFTVVAGLNATSVKALIQGMQVLGTLLPPPEATDTSQAPASGAPPQGGSTALNGQQEIVVLAVNAQQAELIKFAQLDSSISLVLRSPDDFVDANGQPITPVPDETTGVILKTLVDTYGVLPPELVETVLPAQPSGRP